MKYILIILYSCFVPLLSAATPRDPYLVYLASKSKLLSVGEHKDIVTDKAMYVYVLEENFNDRKQFWVYNNKKEKKYLTSAFNITELDPELRLLPSVDGNKIYRQRRILQTDDSTMTFETNFNLHFEQVSMVELNSLYPTQPGSSGAVRYEVRTLYLTQLPIQFGINLNYQSIYWNNADEQIRLSLLSIGPGFSYKTLNNEHFSLSILGNAEIVPLAQSKSTTNTDNFSAYSFDVGIEGELPSSFGNFTIGTHLRRYFLQLENTTRTDASIMQGEYSLSSLGLSLGYKIDWDL